MNIGHLILDEIMHQRMASVHFDGHGYVFTWRGNAAEQLEALVEQHYVRKPTPAQMTGTAHKIISDLKQCDHLAELSHRQLIEEACNQGLGEHLVVMELMNRVLPGWEK